MMMLDVDPKQKKKKGAEYFEISKELDDEWIQKHQAFLVEEQRTKITKKFEKDNEKLVADGDKPLPEKELKERLKAAIELEAKFKKENKTNKVVAEGKSPSVEKLAEGVKKIEERISNLELQAADRDDNKEVALGTSKIVSLLRPLRSGYSCLLRMTDSEMIELHRPASYRGVLQQVRHADREVLLQDAPREV
jgi:DNA topoisomerase-1